MGFAIPAQDKAMAGAFSSPYQPIVRVLSFEDISREGAHLPPSGTSCRTGRRLPF